MKLMLAVAFSVFMIGCPPAHEAIRDGIAANYGFIVTAQQQHLAACTVDATQTNCVLIKRAIDTHRLAQDSLNAYCSGTPAPDELSYDNKGNCVPVKSAEEGLRVAVANLNNIVTSIKAILQ